MDRVPTAARWSAGVVCILFVAVVWTFATVLKQLIFHDLKFDEPFVFAYVCNACYVVYLLPPLVCCCLRRPQSASGTDEVSAAPILAGSESDGRARSPAARAVRLGLLISPLWFASHWSYAQGVDWTSVTSSTVLSTTSCAWTLLGSILVLGERLTPLKVLGVALCIGGSVVQFGGRDAQGSKSELLGDTICLASAMIYSTYTLVLKRFLHEDTPVSLVFGWLGASVILVGTPLVLLLSMPGLRQLVREPRLFAILIFNGFFDNVFSQYAWAKAVQWTSPTATTVGLSLTIPLGIAADLIRGRAVGLWVWISAVLVTAGFFVVVWATRETGPASTQEHSIAAVAISDEFAAPAAPPPQPSNFE